MLPTIEQAEKMLIEAEGMNSGPWGDHSRVVARCAEKIAKKCKLDADKAYILGLLHDIGRRYGVSQLAHTIDGYRFLTKQGYDEVAKVCITHSFAVKDIKIDCAKPDVSKEDYELINQLIQDYEYDDYDRMIQLCDSIAFPDCVIDLKTRIDDVERRYGYYPEAKRQKNYELKEYFEQKMKCNLYEVVSDNKELWGM